MLWCSYASPSTLSSSSSENNIYEIFIPPLSQENTSDTSEKHWIMFCLDLNINLGLSDV